MASVDPVGRAVVADGAGDPGATWEGNDQGSGTAVRAGLDAFEANESRGCRSDERKSTLKSPGRRT